MPILIMKSQERCGSDYAATAVFVVPAGVVTGASMGFATMKVSILSSFEILLREWEWYPSRGQRMGLNSPSGSATGVGFATSAVLVVPFVVGVELVPEVDFARALALLKKDLTLSIAKICLLRRVIWEGSMWSEFDAVLVDSEVSFCNTTGDSGVDLIRTVVRISRM